MPAALSTALVPLALAVFGLQGVLMLLDEFRFHRARSLPRWERIGHPLDTLTVLAPLLIAAARPATAPWTLVFVALAVFSCLFVTKDEWVHARHCGPAEQWVHAVLFLLHPVVFAAAFVLWRAGAAPWIAAQAALVAAFLVWQTLYWNGPWAPSPTRARR